MAPMDARTQVCHTGSPDPEAVSQCQQHQEQQGRTEDGLDRSDHGKHPVRMTGGLYESPLRSMQMTTQ